MMCYEIYDIYGESNEAWKEYFKMESVLETDTLNTGGIADKLKSLDMNSIQEHIKTAQKALNLVQELTQKGTDNLSSLAKGPQIPRPLNKFFED